MTLYFPQLATGTAGQFPLTKTQVRRTVVNRMADGSEVRFTDADAASVVWDLEYRGLSDAERTALAEFFGTTSGRLRSFVFLDPCGNLLAHSEVLTNPVWQVDALMRVEAGSESTRLVNTAQEAQSVSQAVDAPARFRFCGSAEIRCDSTEGVRLWLGDGEARIWSDVTAGPRWSPFACSGEFDSDGASVTFGIELGAGAVVHVRGLQLEAQPARSGHRRTATHTGRYEDTRFDQDELVFRADGIENHSTSLRLVSRVRL